MSDSGNSAEGVATMLRLGNSRCGDDNNNRLGDNDDHGLQKLYME